MNRLISLSALTVLLVYSSGVQAQIFTFGPKAGFNFSTIDVVDHSFDPGIDVTSLDGNAVGLTAGGYLQFNLGPLNFQPEFVFAQDAVALNFRELTVDHLTQVEFNKLHMPLLGGINFGKVVRLQAGPVMTWVVSGHAEPGAGALVETFLEDFDSRTWGYQVGGGLDLGRLALDVRWGSDFAVQSLLINLDGVDVPVDYRRKYVQATLGINIIK